jgi:hypothetical protein
VLRSYLEDNWHYSSVVEYLLDSNDMCTEAEEPSLLRLAMASDSKLRRLSVE